MIGATSLVKVGTAAGAAPPAPSGVEGAACIDVTITARVPRSTGTTRFMAPPEAVILAYLALPAAQDAVAVVTEVTLMRLVGVALMNRPLMTTVWSLCDGMLNSNTPMSRYSFFPPGGVVGISFAC